MKPALLPIAAATALLLGAFTASAQAANLVMLIGEDEYKTWETLPEFAKTELEPLGHRITIIQSHATEQNHFPGLIEALRDADLLFLSVRRKTPPKEELDAVRAFLAAGKPLVGIRTSSHAFVVGPGETLTDPKLAVWPEFDGDVLGGHYTKHWSSKGSVVITLAPGAAQHPILRDIDIAQLAGHGGLYVPTPLKDTAVPLLLGTRPKKPTEPVAWTHLYGPKQAKIFYTSLGHWDDFKDAAFRKLLLNAIAWAL